MKLRTSFFNATVLKKDITRFAPVWGLYTIFMLMYLLLMWDAEGSAARFVSNAPDTIRLMGVVNLFYALLVAVLLFGDLFTPRMCNALHALPLRREGWFLTHLTAGILFCVVPNLLGAVVAALLLQQYAYAAFVWLAVTVLQYLFFFGAGAFSAMCAGNRLGAVAVYGIFNFITVLAIWLVITIYQPFLFGIRLDAGRYADLCPVNSFTEYYMDISYDNMTDKAVFGGYVTENWRYLYLAAGAGVVLLVLAMLIYRRRKLEQAGDFIALRPVAPVFLVIYTLCVGAAMYLIADVMAGELRYIFLPIGLAIGFFTGRMLLERKVNVFRGKNFLGFGAIVAILAASIGLTWLDPAGLVRYVPEPEAVSKVYFSSYDGPNYQGGDPYMLTGQENVQTITQIHAGCVAGRKLSADNGLPLYIRYELTDGRAVERLYYLDEDGKEAQALKKYYSDPNYVFGTDDVQTVLENIVCLEVMPYREGLPWIALVSPGWESGYLTDKAGGDQTVINDTVQGSFADNATVKGLMEAIRADCLAGNMAQLWSYHKDAEIAGYVTIQYKKPAEAVNKYDPYPIAYLELSIYGDCVNTVRYLESLTTQ